VTERQPPQPQPPDEDRVVSRRVDNPTSATPEDERAYRAAGPGSADESPDDTSEPTRSE
jgi:hypothetical protein